MLVSEKEIFEGSGIQVTANGQHHLGAAIGSRRFAEEYVAEKVKLWSEKIRALSNFAQAHPHSAYTAFTNGVIHKWNFLMRTAKSIGDLPEPVEDAIHQFLIPALSGRSQCSELDRELFSLPCRLGGLNILNPKKYGDIQYSGSRRISAPLASLIEQQSDDFHVINLGLIFTGSEDNTCPQLLTLKSRLYPFLQRIVELNSMKCTFLWLTALPIQEQGFYLDKQEFCDALSLRFGWQLYDVPGHCVCGSSFSVDHAMIRKHGGLTFLRHSELCDLTADWLKEACPFVIT